ncbi:tRNA(fMet)-specific endonuclease VapC [Flavobacterium araucananum]|uniref:VapC toxin family PIN domain ribonuclease n=1 Tax=Flavobacterium araucananum TaxID=946678 RepID=A0A227NHQ0_9FLAO|nr:PIN domain-containing protein [Flavobacterium araucananum]OXE96579.1 VapC toxin family PIN domain ribonuclease [Flavobacterium araucananum]PWK01018.1 tRNA(fMet)-specific endonuclease VapC [Flavobacterium araucananum]
MGYLLDTSICVFFLRGRLDLDKIVKDIGLENCYISEITVAELRFGAENSDDPIKSNKAVDIFLKGLTIIPIFGSIKRYAIEKVRLRKIGKPINDEFDLLIGVTAIENQLTLVTDNVKDFKLLNGIQIENWFERS